MRAGDDEGPPAGQEVLAERARHARPREAELLGAHRLGVLLADGVADDDELERAVDVRRVVALQAADPRRFERGAHRRVERHVRAADVVPRVAKEQRELPHSGAGNADEMNAHRARS